jgi:type IVB pilus formation R64 PilN family outer membrane protein
MNIKPQSTLILAAVMAVSGCTTTIGQKSKATFEEAPTNQLVDTLRVEAMKGSAQDIKERGAAYKLPVVRYASSPWIGGAMVPTTKEDTLPAMFNEPYHFDFGDGRVSLGAVAARLTKMTGVPVRIRADVYTARQAVPAATQNQLLPSPIGAAGSAAAALPPINRGTALAPLTLPASAVSSTEQVGVDAVGMRWDGKLRDFLDNMTNTLSLAWEYRDGAVVIMRLVTQSHSIAVLPGAQKYSTTIGGMASGNSQSSTQSTTQQAKGEFSDAGQIDAFTAISESVKSMIAPVAGSSVVLNAQTGTVVVTTSKEVHAQIRDYLDQENARLRQMVNVTLDVYTIKTTDSDAQSINWNLIYKNLSGTIGAGITSPSPLTTTSAGGITVTKLSGVNAGSSLVLNALRASGNSVSHRPISLTTLNGKLRTQTNTATTAYVKETTPGLATSSGAAGAPGLKTDTLVTGDIFAVLPVVQPDNSIILKYSFNLSNLTGLENFTSGSGSTQQMVQIPTTSAVSDGSDLRLQPGDSFLITGLSRITATDDNSRLAEGAPMLLGGSNKKTYVREHFIVLVRATPM